MSDYPFLLLASSHLAVARDESVFGSEAGNSENALALGVFPSFVEGEGEVEKSISLVVDQIADVDELLQEGDLFRLHDGVEQGFFARDRRRRGELPVDGGVSAADVNLDHLQRLFDAHLSRGVNAEFV